MKLVHLELRKINNLICHEQIPMPKISCEMIGHDWYEKSDVLEGNMKVCFKHAVQN